MEIGRQELMWNVEKVPCLTKTDKGVVIC